MNYEAVGSASQAFKIEGSLSLNPPPSTLSPLNPEVVWGGGAGAKRVCWGFSASARGGALSGSEFRGFGGSRFARLGYV